MEGGESLLIGAVDIGGTKIAVGVVDEAGKVLARLECPTYANRGPLDALDRIEALLRQGVKQAGGILSGIGIGCTGPVLPETGTIGRAEFLTGWEGCNLVDELGKRFRVSAAIENDADAAALGEWAWGVGQNTHQFILVTVGTGIGVGMVLNGQLYRGVEGAHPEIGHHVIDISGPGCYCGAKGCWESLASGPAMERWAQDNHPCGTWFSASQLCMEAERGQPLALTAVQRTAGYLGVGLANLVTLFTPEVIALGGGLMQSHHLFWTKIVDSVRSSCALVPYEKVKILPSALGNRTGLIGAARVWYEKNRV